MLFSMLQSGGLYAEATEGADEASLAESVFTCRICFQRAKASQRTNESFLRVDKSMRQSLTS
jgi:hypothetical protein